MTKILSFLGLIKKAGKLEPGEEPAGAASRAKKARLILIASDAADNSFRRAKVFAENAKAPWIKLNVTKAELGSALGRASCAMAAVTDAKFAAALVEKLSVSEPQKYETMKQELVRKAERVMKREEEARAHQKKLSRGKKIKPGK